MPTGNRGPQGRNNGGAGGSPQGRGARDVGQRLYEGVESVGDRAREGYDRAREGLAHGYRQTEGMIARNPAPSVLVGFGVGFGLGLLLTVLLTEREESWYDRYVPDSLRHLPDRLRNVHLPESVSRHFA